MDKKLYPYFFVIILSMIVIASGAFFYFKEIERETVAQKEDAALEEVNKEIIASIPGKEIDLQEDDSDFYIGSSNPKLTMIVYDDPSEPFAPRYYDVIQNIIKEFKDVKVVIRLLPLEVVDNSLYYDEAVACAGLQGKFIEAYEAIILANREKRLTIANLSSILDSVDLDTEKYDKCIQKKESKVMLDKWKQEAEANTIIGVPSTFINNYPYPGAYQLDDFVDSAGYDREGLRTVINSQLGIKN